MKGTLKNLFAYLKTRAGLEEHRKRLGYQSALLHLGLPEIIPFDERHVKVALQRLEAEFGIGNLNTAVHKNDMMFNYRLYQHYGDLQQSLYSYFWVGANLMQNLQALAEEHRLKTQSLLDFGAGYGRVSRFWPHFFPTSHISVSDPKEEALDFQSSQFGYQSLKQSSDPESFPSEKFDLILAVSVFTHLPQENFLKWFETLAGALNEDGALIFTFNDINSPNNRKLIGKAEHRDLHFLENSEETLFPFIADSNTDTSSYGHAFISEGYLRESATRAGLEPTFVGRRLVRNQEAVLLRKGSS